MGAWLTELRRNLPHDIVLHVVGTKSDVVAREPSKREVPFERCIVSSLRSLYFPFPRAAVPMSGLPGFLALFNGKPQLQIAGQAMRRRFSAPPFLAEGLTHVVLGADLG